MEVFVEENFGVSNDPNGDFEIELEFETLFKESIYEVAVINFMAIFSYECSVAKTDKKREKIKNSIVDKLSKIRVGIEGGTCFFETVPENIYNFKKAETVIEENIKRNKEGRLHGKNVLLVEVAAKITFELYEYTCLKMVDEGVMDLVFDEKINNFAFKLKNTQKESINKIKPRRKRK
jgi:hypothetical protein